VSKSARWVYIENKIKPGEKNLKMTMKSLHLIYGEVKNLPFNFLNWGIAMKNILFLFLGYQFKNYLEKPTRVQLKPISKYQIILVCERIMSRQIVWKLFSL
jgi:hypothetical protein